MIRVHLPQPRRADPPQNFSRRGFIRLVGAALSSAAVNSIAQAIQQQEGYYPGSLAYQNNNPGNLVYAGQPGASPGAGGFAQYASYQDGYTALQNQIQLDAVRGSDVNGNPINTLSDLIYSWAPPSQNDTASYLSNVASQTGYSPTDPLSSLGGSMTVDDSGSGNFGDVVTAPAGTSSSFPWTWALAAGIAAVFVLRR